MSLKKYQELKKIVKEANPHLDNHGLNYITSIIYKEDKNNVPNVQELTNCWHDMDVKQIWGRSKEDIQRYIAFLKKYNNSKSTKTLANIRWMQKNKNFLPSVNIKIVNINNEWLVA